ncbi:Sulfotransferase domain containing protein [Trema orientale]|uniref:Sulfotransferase n=1 Tax=Trema orientale TaxID=63057 RepID=A0A2P5EIN2_TREOI|nr:Sulfotransferase domain containing protein [Trema orientale]
MNQAIESTGDSSSNNIKGHINDHDDEEILALISQLPKTKGWLKFGMSQYQDFWCPPNLVANVIRFQQHFQAQDHDIILASHPKSGTIWLKALLYSIINRHRYTSSNTPLLNSNPHQLIPFFEFTLYSSDTKPPNNSISYDPSPRLFSTHIPYASMADSIKHSSKCKIVYISRNPLDVLVSFWHFASWQPERIEEWTMEEYVEKFCNGETVFGPFWNHVLGYWKESLEKPEKVLFLKYEEMKEDFVVQVKKLADFVGFPFSREEESQGVIEQISNLCSFSNLKDLDVNKHGKLMSNGLENKSYFRKGKVGDWVNHLSPSMAARLNTVMKEKFRGSGLTFERSSC